MGVLDLEDDLDFSVLDAADVFDPIEVPANGVEDCPVKFLKNPIIMKVSIVFIFLGKEQKSFSKPKFTNLKPFIIDTILET